MILFPSVMPSSDYEASPMKTSPMQVFINASVLGFFLVMAMGYGNISMVSLSVAFTTMLKAAKPASVFLVCLVFGIEKFDLARVGSSAASASQRFAASGASPICMAKHP